MKLRYSFLLLIGLLLGVGPQAMSQTIPNSGFETWATRNGAEAPGNWLNSDDLYEGSTGAVTKSTDAHTGSFAAKLTNTTIKDPSGSFVAEGAIILGTRFNSQVTYGGYPIGGIPYTARPAQFQFYYKLTGPAADSALTTLLLTSTGAKGAAPTIVGGGILLLAPTTGTGYTQVTVNIPYNPAIATNPDSVRIMFTSGSARTIVAGSTLLVDDVSLIGGTALAVRADASVQARLSVAPNPSPAGRFQLSAPTEPALASAPYTVLDMLGRVVAQQPALAVPSPTRELDLSSLPAGIYLLRIDSKQGLLVRQLAVK